MLMKSLLFVGLFRNTCVALAIVIHYYIVLWTIGSVFYMLLLILYCFECRTCGQVAISTCLAHNYRPKIHELYVLTLD